MFQNGLTNVDDSRLFDIYDDSPAGRTDAKLRRKLVNLDYIKLFFTNIVVREWSKLPPPPAAVQFNLISPFKKQARPTPPPPP